MKQQRFLAVLLCAALFLTLLCACQKTPDASGTSDISDPSHTGTSGSGQTNGTATGPSGTDGSDGTSGSDPTDPSSSNPDPTNPNTSVTPTTRPNTPSNPDDPSESGAERLYSVNVADLGLVGDGKTDNSAKLQDAIDMLSGSTSFYFPAGTYVFNSTVYFRQGNTFIGTPNESGVGGTVLKAGRNMEYVFTNANGDYTKTLTFMNFTCDGNSGSRRIDSFFNLESALGVSMSNMAFCNIKGNAITTVRVEKNAFDWTNHYYNLTFDNVTGYAIDGTQTDCWYSNITVNGGKGIVDRINGGSTYRNITVIGSSESGLSLGGEGRSEVSNSCVINCTFRDNAAYGLYLSSASAIINKQTTVSNCDFSGNRKADICMNRIAESTVYQCNLRSSKPVETNSLTSGVTFVENHVSASSLSLQGTHNEQRQNSFGTSAFPSGRGAQSDEANVSAEMFRILNGRKTVTVAEHGAVEGDRSDISAALQSAINAAAASGGVVIINAGNYALKTTVNVPSNVTIYGQNVSLYPLDGVGTMLRIADASNVKLAGLTFNNSRGVSLDQFILMDNAKNVLLWRVAESSAQKVGNAAIHITASCSDIEFSHCSYNGPERSNTTAILCSGSRVQIHDSYFTHGTVGVHFAGGQNNRIFNTHFDWFTTTAIRFTNTGSAAMNHEIVSNYFDINVLAAQFDFTGTYNSGVNFSCNTLRADGNLISAGQLPPVIEVNNGTGIRFFCNAFEHPKAFTLKGSTSGLQIIGNSSKGNLIASGSLSGSTYENNGIRG